jgi:hypothetical protein
MCKKLIYVVSFVLVVGLVNSATAELVGHWRFDEGTGDAANDSSGNGNHGTLIDSVEWDVGQIGGAVKFDGTPGYVQIPHGDSLKLINQGDFTITMWFRQDVVTGIANLLQQTDLNGMGRTLLLADADTGIRTFLGGTSTVSGVIEEAGIWYHVALIVTEGGATDTINFYIDGEPSGTPAQVDSEDTDGDYLIGTNKGLNGRWINGLVDDFRLYNHALSEAEILAAMEGSEGYPYALGPEPDDGAFIEDTWVSLSWSPGDFTVSHDVYLGDNFNDVNAGAESTFQGNQTSTSLIVGFPGFAFPDGLVPGTTYYWRIDEVNEAEPNSPWKGDIWSFSIPPKTAYFPDPAVGAESVAVDVELSWTAGYGAKLHTVYFGDNFDDVNNAAGGLPLGTTTYTPGPLEMAKTYYWRVDEFDAVDTYKGEVWSFTTEGAVGNPEPANGAVDVKQTAILSWMPGVFAASHQVYFGADKEAVSNADTSSPEYKGVRALGAESYDPGKLEWNTTYNWRIDEVNDVNPDSPWKGSLWSFTTANFLVVDDFENYDVNDNQIWYAWHDGLGYGVPGTDPYYAGNGTGSAVGDESTPSYTEETIVHGGNQSMPVFYDNSILRYSEVEKTLTDSRDWTENGVNRLTIWFRGISDNTAETLYVALNGSTVVNHDNPDAAQVTRWTEWNIDLQAFADQGVNLANVNTIALGLGNKNNPLAGGSGTMYFDDIRLYPPAP